MDKEEKSIITITTFFGDVYYTTVPRKHFLMEINNPDNRFIVIGGKGIAISSISSFKL